MSYQRIGANIEAKKNTHDGEEYLLMRVQLTEDGEPKDLGKSNTGKSWRVATTGGNKELGIVSDDLIDVVAGINVYRPIPKEDR